MGAGYCLQCEIATDGHECPRDELHRLFTVEEAEDYARWCFQNDLDDLGVTILRLLGYEDTGQMRSIRWQKPSTDGVRVFYL